jgi:hypothetical protein
VVPFQNNINTQDFHPRRPPLLKNIPTNFDEGMDWNLN